MSGFTLRKMSHTTQAYRRSYADRAVQLGQPRSQCLFRSSSDLLGPISNSRNFDRDREPLEYRRFKVKYRGYRRGGFGRTRWTHPNTFAGVILSSPS